MRGIRVVPESKERDRLAFAFMSNGISSERQVETAVRQTAALMRADAASRARRSSSSPDPWWCTPAASQPLSQLIRRRLGAGAAQPATRSACTISKPRCSALRSACGQSDGRQEEHGHRNHMRAINAIYHAGGIAKAVESGRLQERRDVRMRARRACRSCWPAACATTVRCPTPSPT